MQLETIIEWVEASDLARTIVTVPWAYPAISALHIIGIAVLFGSILVVDLHLLRVTNARLDGPPGGLVRTALMGS